MAALLAQYLPEDIIHEIILALSTIDEPSRKLSYKDATLGWMKITHICRSWRITAFTCSGLWADVVSIFPRGLDTLLQRCKNAPLTLDFTDVSLEYARRLRRLLSRARVIRQDSGYTRQQSPMNWPSELSGLTLPLLDTISISLPYGGSYIQPPYETMDITPFNAPALRTCRFDRVFVPFVAPNLRSLGIADMYMGYMRLLWILRDCPQLEVLNIMGGLGAVPHEASMEVIELIIEDDFTYHTLHKVELPKLRTLTVHEYPPDVASLIPKLKLPPSVRFQIEYSGYSDRDEFGKLVTGLRAQIGTYNTLSLTAMMEMPHGVEFYLGNDIEFDDHGFIPTTECSYLKTTHGEWTGLVPGMLQRFPPVSISTLAICGSLDEEVLTKHASVKVVRALRHFTAVKTLYVQESGTELLHILASDNANVAGGHPVIFPGLHTVIMHHAPDYSTARMVWWSNLINFLRVRKEAQIAVHTLVVRGNFCHLDGRRGGGEVEALTLDVAKELVEEVVDARYGKCCCQKY